MQPGLSEPTISKKQALQCDGSFLSMLSKLEGSFGISPKQQTAQLSRTQGQNRADLFLSLALLNGPSAVQSVYHEC